jgi:hypothetical protein
MDDIKYYKTTSKQLRQVFKITNIYAKNAFPIVFSMSCAAIRSTLDAKTFSEPIELQHLGEIPP